MSTRCSFHPWSDMASDSHMTIGTGAEVSTMALLGFHLRGERVIVDSRPLTDRQNVHHRLVPAVPFAADEHRLIIKAGAGRGEQRLELARRCGLLVDDQPA